MKNEVKDFRNYVRVTLYEDSPDTDWKKLESDLSLRIGYYQHERLIHLIVTMTFALMTVISFILIHQNVTFAALSVLLLALTIPYIWHYYFLENTVQLLYTYMYEVRKKLNS